MTREEAAYLLENLIGMVEDNQENDYDTAINMAIKALNVPDTNAGDMISRQDARNAICDYVCGRDIRCVENHECRMKKMISDLPPAHAWNKFSPPMTDTILPMFSISRIEGFVMGWQSVDLCPKCEKMLADWLNNDNYAIRPERPKGHWIDTGSGQECSECGEVQHGYDNFRYYCAKCGAEMTEEVDYEG